MGTFKGQLCANRERSSKSANRVVVGGENKDTGLESMKGPSTHPLDRDRFELQVMQRVDEW